MVYLCIMNGLYIHVPFCRRRCIYCGFYSTTCGGEEQKAYVKALSHELSLRCDELPSRHIDTLYIGGGTPAVLAPSLLEDIFKAVGDIFSLSSACEITVEANPDDVTDDWCDTLSCLPINRVSMGVQSFDDSILRALNRRHTSNQAVKAVERLYQRGTDNISVDLIYGLPAQTFEGFASDVDTVLGLPVSHLSAYALMFEEGTPLMSMLQGKVIKEADEELSVRMYDYLMDKLAGAGWEHYEISNFSLPGKASRHNSGYWQEMHYLGCGPSAHSYDGKRRSWNASSLQDYLRVGGDVVGGGIREEEILSRSDLRNERIMKGLRTCKGMDLDAFASDFDQSQLDRLLLQARPSVRAGYLAIDNGFLHLTRQGIFLSDGIMADLMEV